jgi:NitT/TauT family transport system ATP-binding protein
MARGEADDRTTRALVSVGLGSEAGTFPRALSLGMARRVAFARAAVVSPALLLLDEPFVSLDEATAAQLRTLAKSLWRDRRMIVVLVTHNLDEALELADRFIVLDGRPATKVLDLRMQADYALRDAVWREKHRRLLVDGMAGRMPGER